MNHHSELIQTEQCFEAGLTKFPKAFLALRRSICNNAP
jgi:hypothetical protein